MLIALLLACTPPEPPKENKTDKPACDVALDKLAGSQWMHMKPQPTGADKPNPMARIKFSDDAGKLVAEYTAGSLNNVYKYACTNDGKLLDCVETADYTKGFCRASAAFTPDNKCDQALVAKVTGKTPEEVAKVATEVDAALAKLKPAERDQWKKDDNNPNNKIRGHFKVAVNPTTCGLTIQDKYQTLYNGQLAEFENVLGTAKFVKADADYTYIPCTDSSSSWAPDDKDQHSQDQKPGTIKFSAVLQPEQRGGACTFTADIYKDWVKSQSDVPSEKDPKDGPRWNTSIPFTEAGRHVVYFDRSKTCGDKKESLGVTCVMVVVSGS